MPDLATPVSPIRTISVEPTSRKLSLDSSTGKGLQFYLHDTASQPLSGTPISAIFLVQFDVRSGYELKWSKTLDETVSLKGVEFKSLPSGLHEVEREVISFVQSKGEDSLHDLFYGVSVFHQNLPASRDSTRANVKMFSLGVLVDPSVDKLISLSKLPKELNWKPIDYTKGLEYVDQLHKLLDHWNPDHANFDSFEEFFDQHSRINLAEQIAIKSPRTPTSVAKTSSSITNHSHHYLLKLPRLLELLGPLVFRVWRNALLRKRIVFFDAPDVELNCSFSYCLSVLSTLPQDIAYMLNESGGLDDGLKYLQPIYSIGVNDIDWLKGISGGSDVKNGFIACSTDEILSFKREIHDVAVHLNALNHHVSKTPDVIPSDVSLPGTSSIAWKATQRDLKRFKILSKEFNLVREVTSQDPIDENGDLKWWSEVTEPASWRQIAWSGFYWWASAGEKSKVECEQEYEGLSDIDSVDDEVERALLIVGYFLSMTKRIFTVILDVMSNESSSVDSTENRGIIHFEVSDVFEMGLDPYSSQDAEFISELVKVWFNSEVKIGSNLSNMCCF